MIKNWELVRNLERQQLADTPVDYDHNVKIFESLWQEAKELGALEGLNELIENTSSFRIARFLNSRPLV